MVLKLQAHNRYAGGGFENDVKTYGTETTTEPTVTRTEFENDVKTYGTETEDEFLSNNMKFENDVKTYGTETLSISPL